MCALAKWQRNDLFEAVGEGMLDPQECTFQADDTATVITHTRSRARFVVAQTGGHYRTSSLVGDGPDWSIDRYTWATVPEAVERWAREVVSDTETPDTWAELQRQREVFSGTWTAGVQNTPFTPDERTAIAEHARQVKGLISETYALSEAQMESLEERLDYVAETSARMGRKDWALLVGGVMLAWLLESLVPPETVQHIFSTLSEGVRHLVEGEPWAVSRSCRAVRRSITLPLSARAHPLAGGYRTAPLTRRSVLPTPSCVAARSGGTVRCSRAPSRSPNRCRRTSGAINGECWGAWLFIAEEIEAKRR